MTIQDLEQIIFKEHQRDKRLTLLAFGLFITVVAIAAVLFYVYAFDFIANTFNSISDNTQQYAASEETPLYYKLIIPVAVLSVISYPVILLLRLSKRKKRIEEFTSKIESGLIALSIHQRIVYKITIPLLKINFKLAPVEYVSVVLDQDTSLKPYDFPIKSSEIPNLKILLSGVNSSQINKNWDDLYSNGANETDQKEYDLKPQSEFKTFLEKTLSNDINELDEQRSKSKGVYTRYLIFAILIVAVFGVGYAYLSYADIEFTQQQLIYAFVAFFGLFYLFFFISKGVKKKSPTALKSGNSFKLKILKPIIEFINPHFNFILHGHISLPELLETGLLENRQYTISGNDQIIGNHKGIPFQLSDLDVEFKKNFSNEKDGPDNVFMGQVFIAKFNKSFQSELYLVPKTSTKNKVKINVADTLSLGLSSRKTSDIDLYTSTNFGSKVELEDPEFMKLFHVYCNDQVEARYILNPAMMERIKTLTTNSKGNMYFSFRNDRISVLNNSGINNFEAGYFKSIGKNDNQMLLGFYTDLCDQLSIIDDLKLNINIWNKP